MAGPKLAIRDAGNDFSSIFRGGLEERRYSTFRRRVTHGRTESRTTENQVCFIQSHFYGDAGHSSTCSVCWSRHSAFPEAPLDSKHGGDGTGTGNGGSGLWGITFLRITPATLISIKHTAKLEPGSATTVGGVRTPQGGRGGLTDSSERGPQPWSASFRRGAVLERFFSGGGGREGGRRPPEKMELKGKESDAPLFLLHLSPPLQ